MKSRPDSDAFPDVTFARDLQAQGACALRFFFRIFFYVYNNVSILHYGIITTDYPLKVFFDEYFDVEKILILFQKITF